MIKKLSVLFLLLIAFVFNSKAINILFYSENISDTTLKSEYIDIRIRYSKSYSDSLNITLELKNKDFSRSIYIFDGEYTEKQLKKLSPKTKYAKDYVGSKETTIAGTGITNNIILDPDDLKIITYRIKEGESKNILLPIYWSTYENKGKGKKEYKLQEQELIDLNVSADFEVERELLNFKWKISQLIDEISKKKFCNSPYHNPSYEQQVAEYEKRITTLRKEIIEYIKDSKLQETYHPLHGSFSELIGVIDSPIEYNTYICEDCSMFEDVEAKLKDFTVKCNQLIAEISSKTFCDNPKHKPSYAEQISPYEKKRKGLISEIEKYANQLKGEHSIYEEFAKLVTKLKNITYKKKDCGGHNTPDVVLKDFTVRCNQLIAEISSKTFCDNPKHKLSFEEQIKPYEKKRKALISEIEKYANPLKGKHSIYEEFAKLVTKLKNITYKKKDCGKHDSVQTCQYCKWTLDRILEELDDIYIEIYASDSINESLKNKYKKEVNGLYKCAKEHHKKEWKNDSKTRQRIEEHYDKIMGMLK